MMKQFPRFLAGLLLAGLALPLCGGSAPWLTEVNSIDVGSPIRHGRGTMVQLDGRRCLLVKHSDSPRIDPWQEAFVFPTDTYKLSLLDLNANKLLWTKDLGPGIVTGDWFCPVLSFDLDKDGNDEIFFVDNERPKFPMSLVRSVVGLRAKDGKEFLRIKMKDYRVGTPSESYRFVLMAGRDRKGNGILIFQNGTYDYMDFYAYDPAGKLLWKRVIKKDGTPRASHSNTVYDFNGDGADELLWGERLIDISTGQDLFICTEDGWDNHSDTVLPVFDREFRCTGFWTGREGKITPGRENDQFRCNFYGLDGKRLWGKYRKGHMDRGGAFRINAAGDKLLWNLEQPGSWMDNKGKKYQVEFFDCKGNPVKLPLETDYALRAIDIDGDGVHELILRARVICDLKGKELFRVPGNRLFSGHIREDLPGEQFVCGRGSKVIVLADPNAKWSDAAKKRYAHPYYINSMKDCGVGYNYDNDMGGL